MDSQIGIGQTREGRSYPDEQARRGCRRRFGDSSDLLFCPALCGVWGGGGCEGQGVPGRKHMEAFCRGRAGYNWRREGGLGWFLFR